MASLFERRVRRAINRHRADHDLAPVYFDRRANQSARIWAGHLKQIGLLVHQDPDRISRIAGAQAAGEVLGRGDVAAEQFGHLWLASPAHRAVMLNPTFRGVGIAAVPTVHGRLVVVNLVRR